ncbi:uncharacterized protein [Anolis sagrei]|uniref:uncharacterized protein n=1 Tax=Anolis sagrei TaxID=38937 RepID=UPI003522A8F0
MALIMTSLLCIWALIPLVTARLDLYPCVFPFIYKQKLYTSCTKDGAVSRRLWCATTENYDRDRKWKHCTSYEYGGNSRGQKCTFPFVYKKRTFYTCTNENALFGRFWCATTGSYDKDRKWSYCADTRLIADSQGPCVFPFTFNFKSYSACTTDGDSNGKLWCSLTSNYTKESKWAYCDQSEPRPCVFPFIYNKKSYSNCTKDGSANDQLWCATTANYDTDSKWKECSLQEYEGSAKGQPCVFPFTAEKQTFYTCTNKPTKDGRYWCATTGSYDKDKKWSYCADTRLDASPKGSCVFPFTYKGTSYSSCTTAGDSRGKLWCSLTKNFDVDRRWTYCDSSEVLPCHFPFTWGMISYSECTKRGAADDQLWCATTPNYDRDSKWKACSLQEYEGNSGGQSCVFPFLYKNQTFYTCTNDNSKDGRFWCATTNNYDTDKMWSYCADTRLDATSKGPCTFPFIYRKKSYSSCTSDGEISGKLWCSLTDNFDVDRKWTYCN